VPTKAIELANAKVANVTPHNNRTRTYLILMPAQKYEVGKQASEHNMTTSINFTRGAVQALLTSFFISPKAVWKIIHQISPCQSFPLYGITDYRFM